MRVGDLEFRRIENREAEIVGWRMPDMKEYCFTIAFFKKDSEGYYMETVGNRLVDEDPVAFHKLMKYAFTVLNAEFDLLEDE
jgi:hypothetical protein